MVMDRSEILYDAFQENKSTACIALFVGILKTHELLPHSILAKHLSVEMQDALFIDRRSAESVHGLLLWKAFQIPTLLHWYNV